MEIHLIIYSSYKCQFQKVYDNVITDDMWYGAYQNPNWKTSCVMCLTWELAKTCMTSVNGACVYNTMHDLVCTKHDSDSFHIVSVNVLLISATQKQVRGTLTYNKRTKPVLYQCYRFVYWLSDACNTHLPVGGATEETVLKCAAHPQSITPTSASGVALSRIPVLPERKGECRTRR